VLATQSRWRRHLFLATTLT